MDVELSQDGSSSVTDNQNLETDQSSPATHGASASQAQAITNAITELDKLERFRFEGQEYNPKSLKEAILRAKDYTQKTQVLTKDRESFDQERKFYDNLWSDLWKVQNGHATPAEFIQVYPQKFHGALKQVLESINGQGGASQQNQQNAFVDVDARSQLAQMQKVLHEQEVAKRTTEINSNIAEMSKKYPNANAKVAIADIYEAYNKGLTPSLDDWDKAFKASQDEEDSRFKARYGEMQKKQTVANAKARDVDAGGGTPGRAPKKFGSLREVTEHAAESIASARS